MSETCIGHLKVYTDIKNLLYQLFIYLFLDQAQVRWEHNTLQVKTIEKHRKSPLSKDKEPEEKPITVQAPRDYKYVTNSLSYTGCITGKGPQWPESLSLSFFSFLFFFFLKSR